MVAVSCDRKIDGLELATYPTSPDVFIDGFSTGLYYAAYGTSKVTAFSIDNEVKYSGTASMRFDVPDAGDPNGSYIGGVFGANPARDLSGYNVLTFWAKASQPATIDQVGFGQDMGENKYQVFISNLAVNYTWKQFYILIPNPSLLTQEKGMLFYSATPQNGRGFTFWIDEVKFEKLGTIAHEVYKICNGNDSIFSGPAGNYTLNNFSATFNLPTSIDQAENIAISYFTFTSSDTSKATVSNTATIILKNSGGVITASVGNIAAKGSLTLNVTGPATAAPNPTVAGANVISIYSNSYTNIKIDSYEPFWVWTGGGFTTNYSTFKINGNDVIHYSNYNDTYNQKCVFLAITFPSSPINISTMIYFHMDVWVPSTSPNLTNKPTIKLQDVAGLATQYVSPSALLTDQWVNLEIPLASFSGTANKSNIIYLILNTFPSDIYVDNIYFHK